MNSTKAIITSVGHYVPPDVYDNHYFEEFLETNDQWIRERTGIVERRFLKDGATSDLAVPAVKRCLERRGLAPEDIDCIIVATVTPDMFFPSTACHHSAEDRRKECLGIRSIRCLLRLSLCLSNRSTVY